MTNAVPKWFGERLRKARADHVGLTQGELSTLSGVSAKQISIFESSKCLPSLDNFKKLCITLDINADYLLGIVGRPVTPKLYMSKVTTTPDSDTFTSFDELVSRLTQDQAETVVHVIFGLLKANKHERLRAKEENDV